MPEFFDGIPDRLLIELKIFAHRQAIFWEIVHFRMPGSNELPIDVKHGSTEILKL
jgi:hypothetical protein